MAAHCVTRRRCAKHLCCLVRHGRIRLSTGLGKHECSSWDAAREVAVAVPNARASRPSMTPRASGNICKKARDRISRGESYH